ncbi:MAG: hypothetical protein QOJ91_2368 [Sphingomonadales bacterium]|jgi:hypothetical protein|nr:hypothetical protein [Sphingomonadales bacterium]
MPVNLQHTPTINSTDLRINFMNAGAIVATLDAGDANALSIVFDSIRLNNPGHQPVIRMQNPNVPLAVHPGEIAYVSMAGGQVLLQHARWGGHEQTITF